MSDHNQPIGLFDSGVGGLSILKSIERLMPNENLIYIADSQFVPYGEKSEQEIEDRVLTISKKLIEFNVKAIVVACNTATATAVTIIRKRYSIPIIGIEPALKPAIAFSGNKKIGILATQATLASQKFNRLKEKLSSGITLIEKTSPLFVQLVESGLPLTKQQRRDIEKELQSFKQANIDALILGCTHYPFLSDIISLIMGPKVTLFESGEPVAKEVQRQISEQLNTQEATGWQKFYASNPKNYQPIFEQLLNKKIKITQLF